MTIIPSPNAHHVSVCEETVPLYKKGPSYGYMLSCVNCGGHSRVSIRNLCWTNEMDGTILLRQTINMSVILTGRYGEKNCQLVLWEQKSVVWVEDLVNTF